jgi:B9 domain-containing protein 2
VAGREKFESFEAESVGEITPIEQPFALEYVSNAVRGWPRLLVEIWRVDEYGRHNIYGYGTAAVPMASGWHRI